MHTLTILHYSLNCQIFPTFSYAKIAMNFWILKCCSQDQINEAYYIILSQNTLGCLAQNTETQHPQSKGRSSIFHGLLRSSVQKEQEEKKEKSSARENKTQAKWERAREKVPFQDFVKNAKKSPGARKRASLAESSEESPSRQWEKRITHETLFRASPRTYYKSGEWIILGPEKCRKKRRTPICRLRWFKSRTRRARGMKYRWALLKVAHPGAGSFNLRGTGARG